MKKKPITPKSRIVSALRRLWLQSRERAAALKRDGNTCQVCFKKGSKAKGKEVKVCVHHVNMIDWSDIAELIRDRIMQTPEKLQTLCNECHDVKHENDQHKFVTKKAA